MVEQLEEKIIFFLNKTCDIEMYERMNNSDYKFDGTHQEFLKHNITHIKTLVDKELIFLSKLIDLITEQKLNMVDEEDFIEHAAIGFYYNYEYKLVIVHEDD
jgi:hypothetical protein